MVQNTRSTTWRKVFASVALSLLLLLCLGLAWAYFRSQQVPEFYQRAKDRLAERSDQLTLPSETSAGRPPSVSAHKLSHLLTTLNGPGASRTEADEWLDALGVTSGSSIQETLREDDVNACLAKELPNKFRYCLPPCPSEPQVQISNGKALVGFRYQEGGLDGIVSLEVDVAITGQRSQLGIRLRSISVGTLPLPMGQVLDLISDAALRSQGPAYRGPDVVTWTQQGGDPVALLPGAGPGGGYFNELESFSLRDKEVEVVIKRRPIQRR